jgi:ribosomal-protein-alanine N-acetyltransferase
MFEMRTKRLLLRDFLDEDLFAYQNVGNNAEALRYYPQDPSEWSVHVNGLVQMFREWRLEKPRQKYALAILARDSFVGTVSVRIESSEHRQGSIGCGLAYEYWSLGYASEAMTAAIKLGFENLDLHRIYAETISENRAAVALAERLGMRIEGTLRENQYFKGRWWNTTILSLLRTDWQDKPAGERPD